MTRPQAIPELEHEQQDELTPMYHVVLLDDDYHTYDYVIEMLQRLLLISAQQAFRHAEEVDTTGRTIVMTCDLSAAEYTRSQIQGYGPDWRMPESKGSMSAILEPAGTANE